MKRDESITLSSVFRYKFSYHIDKRLFWNECFCLPSNLNWTFSIKKSRTRPSFPWITTLLMYQCTFQSPSFLSVHWDLCILFLDPQSLLWVFFSGTFTPGDSHSSVLTPLFLRTLPSAPGPTVFSTTFKDTVFSGTEKNHDFIPNPTTPLLLAPVECVTRLILVYCLCVRSRTLETLS